MYCVGVILLLGLGFFAAPLHAQDTGAQPPSVRERGFRLQQNYPNPFNPHTYIPFGLDEGLFQAGKPVRVTIRIYNVLQQLVATPVALNYSTGNRLTENLEYGQPGDYVAFWDGHDRSGRPVASGIYYVLMSVNGRTQVTKVTVSK
jgi:hypothetical protein